MARKSGLLSAVLLRFSCRLMISLSHVQYSLYTQKVYKLIYHAREGGRGRETASKLSFTLVFEHSASVFSSVETR